ncbi:hypothetical protein Droror1_Dr00012046 [Drosera rotundifolia]
MEDNYSNMSSSEPPPPKKELQGPRPTPLKVRKDSHKIKKPPIAPQSQPQHPPPQQAPQRPPVIIYTVSPKVIHTSPADFMALVQRLTGSDSTAPSSSTAFTDVGSGGRGGGGISPAARFASIENTKVSPRQQSSQTWLSHDTLTDFDETVAIQMGGRAETRGGSILPGILSPEPGSLPPIPVNLFSPSVNRSALASLLNDIGSPNVNVGQVQHGTRTSYMVSPSAAQFFSPGSVMFSPATLDILRNFLD